MSDAEACTRAIKPDAPANTAHSGTSTRHTIRHDASTPSPLGLSTSQYNPASQIARPLTHEILPSRRQERRSLFVLKQQVPRTLIVFCARDIRFNDLTI